MYRLINSHISLLLNKLDDGNFVPEYEWLLSNVRKISWPDDFEQRYTRFWRLNAGRLTPAYRSVYFGELRKELVTTRHRPLPQLCLDLYQTPSRKSGKQTLQFSFSTKLFHMLDPHLPVYDSLVAKFYFFTPPAPPADHNPKPGLLKLMTFYDWLQAEYARVLSLGLLASSLSAFNARFPSNGFADEKIIDSLIWAFVGEAGKRNITYR